MSPYAFFAVSLIPLSAAAALADDETPKAYGDLIACRAIEDSAARLACFDNASAQLEKAREAKEVLLVETEEVRKARKEGFGGAQRDLPGTEGVIEDIDEISTTFESVGNLGYGKWQFTIPNGGTWQTTDALTKIPKVGEAITIRKGFGGSFMMRIGNGRITRVKRIDRR
jgi:hypothetical protein